MGTLQEVRTQRACFLHVCYLKQGVNMPSLHLLSLIRSQKEGAGSFWTLRHAGIDAVHFQLRPPVGRLDGAQSYERPFPSD